MDTAQVVDIVSALGRLGVVAASALSLARRLRAAPGGRIELAPGVSLLYDHETHLADFGTRLRDATERVVQPRRGRPPRRAG
jgi:hypothetical protein